MATTIRNLIEVKPGLNGGVILIPGCEATSIHSSDVLSASLRLSCKSTLISLNKALEVIPGSSTIKWHNSSGMASGKPMRFFVLPSGPPQVGCANGKPGGSGCVNDWYDIMRANADVGLDNDTDTPTVAEVCETFSFQNNGAELL